MSYGWRGGAFKVEIVADAQAGPDADPAAADNPLAPRHVRTLGDTFEE